MAVTLTTSERGAPCARRNACYDCTHRCDVFDSDHSESAHPQRADLTIEGELHGSTSGWFTWPWNFDPVWLRECDGFTPKEVPNGEA